MLEGYAGLIKMVICMCFAYKLHQNIFGSRGFAGPAVELNYTAPQAAGFRKLGATLLKEEKGMIQDTCTEGGWKGNIWRGGEGSFVCLRF